MKTKQTVTVLCVVFAVILIVALVTNLISLASLNSRKKALEVKISELDKQLSELDSMIALRETDEFVDKFVREYLQMHGSDEVTFVGEDEK